MPVARWLWWDVSVPHCHVPVLSSAHPGVQHRGVLLPWELALKRAADVYVQFIFGTDAVLKPGSCCVI